MFLVNNNDILYIFITFIGGIGILFLFVILAILSQKIASKKKIKEYANLESEIYRIIYENNNITYDEIISMFENKKEDINNAINNLIVSNKIIKIENNFVIRN